MPDPRPIPAPPKLLSAQDFSALARTLQNVHYTQEAIGARLGLRGPLDYEAVRALPERQGNPRDALELLLRLFVLGVSESGLEIKKHLATEFGALLEAFGLLHRVPTQPGKWAAQAMLYPLRDILIVSDRWNSADGSPYQSFPDIVYPANSNNTLQFLECLPQDPCERFLELCAGTGVIALLAAKHYAKHAWATDIAPRSVHFAEFNRRLNALSNVTVRQGDLFEPASAWGGQFDRIAAHPPYMPSLKPAEVYYDGGPDGELITSTIIRDVSKYLEPGARMFLQTMGTDRQNISFEQRIRSWLDSASDEFNLAIIARRLVEPGQFAIGSAVRDGGGNELANQWKAYFRKREIVRLVYGLIVLERKSAPGTPFTIQRMVGEQSGWAETEWLLRWEAEAHNPERIRKLLLLRPMTSPRAELRITHKKVAADLVPAEAMLVTDYPFSLECKVPAWTGYLLALSDGTRTVAQICEECKQRQCIPANTPVEEFAGYTANLISGGILEVLEWPLPRKSI